MLNKELQLNVSIHGCEEKRREGPGPSELHCHMESLDVHVTEEKKTRAGVGVKEGEQSRVLLMLQGTRGNSGQSMRWKSRRKH